MKTLAELNMTPLVAVVDIETASRKPNAASCLLAASL